jgi:hypothetical protein
MCNDPSRAHDPGMSSARNPRITLELEPGADPIRGTIDDGHGSRVRFWGWLELMEELRRVAAGEPGRPSSPPNPTDIAHTPEAEARTKRRQPHRTTGDEP